MKMLNGSWFSFKDYVDSNKGWLSGFFDLSGGENCFLNVGGDYCKVKFNRVTGKLSYAFVGKKDIGRIGCLYYEDEDRYMSTTVMYCKGEDMKKTACELVAREYLSSVRSMKELQKTFLERQREYQNAVKYIAETRNLINEGTLGLLMSFLSYDFESNIFTEKEDIVSVEDDITMKTWVDEYGKVRGQCARNEIDECKKLMIKKQMELLGSERAETDSKIARLLQHAREFGK